MKASRAMVLWAGVIAALLLLEVAEITHLFQVPVQSAIGNLVAFVFALVFTMVIALIGALFIGIYISQRMQSTGGFTAFEEEMLRMRADVSRIAEEVAEIRRRPPPPVEGPAPPEERR